MRTITLFVGLMLTAASAFAQARTYTNADLTSGPVTWTRTVTPEELRGLEAHQFRALPAPERPIRADGPRVVVLPHTPWFAPFAPTAPLSEPWSMTTYVGRGYGHGGPGRRGGPTHGGLPAPTTGIHLRYP